MRIVHLVDRPAEIGGVPTYLAELLPALRDRGVESVVLSGDASVRELAGARCVHVPEVAAESARLGAEAAGRLRAAVGSAGADVVYAHLASSPGAVLAAAEQAPVAVYAHDYYAVCPGSMRYLHRSETLCVEGPGLRCFWRAYTERSTNRRPDRLVRAYARVRAWRDVWPRVSRVFVASPFVAELLRGDGVPQEALRVVPYFVRPEAAPPTAPEHDVLYLGRLVAAKGVHVLLRALAALDGVTATIAGDGPERQALVALSGRLGLAGRVRFTGWIPPAERPRLLAATRVLALPSLWDEPFGIVGVEALSAGVPVVGSAVGGIPSWLEEGAGGSLVPRGDSTALAAALRRLLDDRSVHADQSSRARAAASRFSVERHLELLLPELRAAAGSD